MDKIVKILNINISTLLKVEILNYIKESLINDKKLFLATPNPEIILEANKNNRLKEILNNKTNINTPDGKGVLFASKILKTEPQIKERITGSDLTLDIIKISKELNKKIFLLGGNSIEQLKIIKNKINIDCNCVYDDCYDIGFKKEDWDKEYNYNLEKNNFIVEKINNSNAEILLVAFGAPKQEIWIDNNLDKLKNIKIVIGIGGTFDFLSGYKKRAPKWMQKAGIEWLFRLIQEPKRIKRIINAVIIFPMKIFKLKLSNLFKKHNKTVETKNTVITSDELRRKYIEFFKSKAHAEIKSASIVPENDPSVLFTTAGMHPLVPYLLGEKHPAGTRLTDTQKCIRTGDIEDVGDNRHLTFFEMLGNWSLGDYFKEESISWSFEFLTNKEKGLGLDPNRLYFTVFKGENGIPRDEDAIKIWQKVLAEHNISNGVSTDECIHDGIRIIPLGVNDNFWIAGETGPCGGDTEFFYDTNPEAGKMEGKFEDLVDSFRIVEIWNNVFMEFNKTAEGQYEKLPKPNVDTGMGLERVITVLNNAATPFETDIFSEAINKIAEISGIKYEDNKRNFRIIADHIKAATFILGDDKNIVPSGKDQGYVLRKLIRRAIRAMHSITDNNTIFTPILAKIYIEQYKEVYTELERNSERILSELEKEENKFKETLNNGVVEFEKIYNEIILKNENKISGEKVFLLYQSFGFPLEITKDLCKEKNIVIDENEFNEELKKHQELSKANSDKKFKGGLADSDPRTVRLHTAAHLMLQSLRIVLGDHVFQKGSNITSERLRFDFSHSEKMTPEQIQKVEDMVNEQIQRNLEVTMEEMTVEEAEKQGAMGAFKDRYGEIVKVYTIGDFSKEICGGPHVQNTSEMGHFKIIKEESSSSGVRRIKAILE